MLTNNDFQAITDQINKAKSIYILLPENPSTDMVASGLGLYLGLQNHAKDQKDVFIACPTPMRVEFSRLVGVDKIAAQLGNRNLVISFDYIQDSIEKVSYHVEGDKFNLVIQPKNGVKPLSSQNVNYSYAGAAADLVFIIGASNFANLGSFYEAEKKLFTDSETVSLDRGVVAPFARQHLSDAESNSISELVIQLLDNLKVDVKDDIATNLMAGIDATTGRLGATSVTAQTFTLAARLIQNGAVRQPVISSSPTGSGLPANLMPSSMNSPFMQNPMTPAASAANTPFAQALGSPSAPSGEPTSPIGGQNLQAAPSDWLQPKIFKGSSQV